MRKNGMRANSQIMIMKKRSVAMEKDVGIRGISRLTNGFNNKI